ncbi:hypothetical protein JL721_6746 [Aureococcus anophagefferens]|nr:hypothetical protein JL721_6746 [Aureococcus anophagefferens]
MAPADYTNFESVRGATGLSADEYADIVYAYTIIAAEAPVELPELPVRATTRAPRRGRGLGPAHAVSGTSNTIKEIYAAVADRFGVELTKPWKKLISVVTGRQGDDGGGGGGDDDEAGEAPVRRPTTTSTPTTTTTTTPTRRTRRRGARRARRVGESGDDDDDDGLKIYDDCDDDDDDASFDEPDLEPKPKHKQTRDDSVPWRTTKTWTGGTFDEKALDDHLELLSEDGSEWTGGGGYSQKCKWEKKLKCPCKVRIVHPADQPGVTYFQERLGHVHNFDDEMKTSTTLPVKIREIVAPIVLMTTAPKHKIWQLLEAKGVDVVNDFPATTDNIAQDHLVGLDEVDELDDEHRVFVLDGSVIDADSKTILLGMSTKHLLKNLARGQIICSDGTFRVTWQGTLLLRRHRGRSSARIAAGWLLKSENKDDITVIYDKTLSYVEALAPFEREQMRHSMEDNCAIFRRLDAFQAEYVDGDKGHWQQAKFAPQQPTTSVAQESFMNRSRTTARTASSRPWTIS